MICEIENLSNGKVKILSLPKEARDLDVFLMEFGLNDENNFAHEIVSVDTGSRELNSEIISRKLTVDELNYFAFFYELEKGNFEDRFINLIYSVIPTTNKDFLNLAFDSVLYDFHYVSGDEEAYRLLKEDYPEYEKMSMVEALNDAQKNKKGKFVNRHHYAIRIPGLCDGDDADFYNGISMDSDVEDDGMRDVARITLIDFEAHNKKCDEIPKLTINLPTTDYSITRALHRMRDKRFIIRVERTHMSKFPITRTVGDSIREINYCAEIWAGIEDNNALRCKLKILSKQKREQYSARRFLEIYYRHGSYRFYPGICSETSLESLEPIKSAVFPTNEDPKKLAKDILSRYEHDFVDEGLVLKTKGNDGFEAYFDIEWA